MGISKDGVGSSDIDGNDHGENSTAAHGFYSTTRIFSVECESYDSDSETMDSGSGPDVEPNDDNFRVRFCNVVR